MERIGAMFNGQPAEVHAAAHGAEPGTIVVPIAHAGTIELSVAGARRLMFQLAGAHVKALQLQAEHDEQAREYANA